MNTADVIDTVYYGEEQDFDGSYNPTNREPMWTTKFKTNNTPLGSVMKTLNKLRSYAIGDGARYEQSGSGNYVSFLSYPVFNSTHVVAFRKGYAGNQVVYVVSNLGSQPGNNPEASFTLNSTGTGFHPRQNLTEILSCESFLADSDSGDIDVNLHDGGPRVYYPTDSLGDSGICGNGLSTENPATPTTSASGTAKPASPTKTGSGSTLHALSGGMHLVSVLASWFLMFS